MKTLLLTSYDNKMKGLGDLTSPLMLSYASKHGMDFRCIRIYPFGEPPYLHTVIVNQALADGYDRVIWMDADIIITNPEFVPPFTTGFHASKDWGQDAVGSECFSLCCFVACQDSKYLFEWCIERRQEYLFGEFPEQKPMRELYEASEENRKIMTIHPNRIFNSVPIEVHETVREPWQIGDWLCHLTMISIPERIKLFHKIKDKNETT